VIAHRPSDEDARRHGLAAGPRTWERSVRSNLNTRKVFEAAGVGGEHCAAGGDRGRGDEKVVSSAWPTCLADGRQQLGVVARDPEVVGQRRDGFQDSVEESLASGAARACDQVHPDQELGGRHRRDCDVVVVCDDLVEVRALSLGVDQEGGVEQQQAQGRSSSETARRTSLTSCVHSASIACSRSACLIASPLPRAAGSKWATALPRRMIVNCSPRSTASSRSAKFRAASVALTSVMRSDYQMMPSQASDRPWGDHSAVEEPNRRMVIVWWPDVPGGPVRAPLRRVAPCARRGAGGTTVRRWRCGLSRPAGTGPNRRA
jgi:hypothetical protein